MSSFEELQQFCGTEVHQSVSVETELPESLTSRQSPSQVPPPFEISHNQPRKEFEGKQAILGENLQAAHHSILVAEEYVSRLPVPLPAPKSDTVEAKLAVLSASQLGEIKRLLALDLPIPAVDTGNAMADVAILSLARHEYNMWTNLCLLEGKFCGVDPITVMLCRNQDLIEKLVA